MKSVVCTAIGKPVELQISTDPTPGPGAVLVQVTEKPFTREILSEVQKRVHEGSSFGDALAEHPNIFSKLYINMIRAGEAGGMLPSVLNRLAEFMENSEEMKANIRSAMIYPAILTLVGGSAVLFEHSELESGLRTMRLRFT